MRESTKAGSVTLRPRRWRQIGVIVAALVVGVGIVSAATFSGTKASNGGRVDGTVERVALVAVGVVFGAVALWLRGRPRIRADQSSIEVRNIIAEYTLPWTAVAAIRVPRAGLLANLELTTGDILGMHAVQSIDGTHAVKAVAHLRALHSAAATDPPAEPATGDTSSEPSAPPTA